MPWLAALTLARQPHRLSLDCRLSLKVEHIFVDLTTLTCNLRAVQTHMRTKYKLLIQPGIESDRHHGVSSYHRGGSR